MGPTSLRSFICEHTSEFLVVPALTQTFERRFAHVAAFYFWGSREGSNTARLTAPDRSLRVVVVYPRRPKIDSVGQLWIKINSLLYEDARYWALSGTPVLCSVPHASGISEINSKAKCISFVLDPLTEPRDHLCPVGTGLAIEATGSCAGLDRPLTEETLLATATGAAQLTWDDLIRRIRSKPHPEGRNDFFRFGPVYKPIYFGSPDVRVGA